MNRVSEMEGLAKERKCDWPRVLETNCCCDVENGLTEKLSYFLVN